MRAIIIGIIAAFFFAFTFVLNQLMSDLGGDWMWSASLRYFFMVPFLLLLVLFKSGFKKMWSEIKKRPFAWFIYSQIGFGLFYAPLCFAADYSPGWLVAGTWQITIVAGALMSPLFYEKIQTATGIVKVKGRIPLTGLCWSGVIIVGIIIMEVSHATTVGLNGIVLGTLPIIIAAFAYPYGNRKMMEVTEGRLNVFERVLGMTLCSLPTWLILSIIAGTRSGIPSMSQVSNSIIIALFSGVIATLLFFKATDLTQGRMKELAAVEATQSMEAVFSFILGLLILNSAVPSLSAWIGLIVVVFGMTAHSLSQRN